MSTFSRNVAVDAIPRAFKMHAAIGRWEDAVAKAGLAQTGRRL